MTKDAHDRCTCSHTHEVAPPPANPPSQSSRATLLRDLFSKQEMAIRDLMLQVVTVGNRVVGVEAKVVELGDQIHTIGTKRAAPPASDSQAD